MTVQVNGVNYYTTKDLVEKFKVSNETIRDWRDNKGLKFNKISPKKFIYSENDLENFLKGK